jgi:ferritin
VISDKMQKALNEQINAELHSAYLYLSMAAYFKSLNLDGAEHWMRLQVQEELAHAGRFYDYVNLTGGRVLLSAIPAVATEWNSPLAAFEAALGHERGITERIANLVSLAAGEKDHGTGIMLQWFVSEQVEEEANADGIVRKLKLVGQEGPGLFMLDRQLMTRTLSPAGGKGA